MMETVSNLLTTLDRARDPRTKSYFLMNTPYFGFIVCSLYVYFVKVLGPRLMQNRKPFELRNTLIIYNGFQVALSLYLFLETSSVGWLNGHSWVCQPVDYSYSPNGIRELNISYVFHLAKFSELLDTVFFVLRKKYNQVTVLHVVHHGIMPLSTWLGFQYVPGGHATFFGFVNSFVHVIMYSYYMLSAFGPSIQKYLWWKKYLTTLQMVQFVMIFVHAFQLLFIECDFTKFFSVFIGAHGVMFYFLFKNFYDQTYNKPKTT